VPALVSRSRGPMTVGMLTASVNFEAPEGTSGTGYATTLAGVPAHIRSAVGNELLRFGAQVATNAVIITVLYRTDVRADWRVSFPAEGRVFQITGYGDEAGDRVWTTIYGTEVLQ
jgi:SPP1 family predicted phage head-tail adaptor